MLDLNDPNTENIFKASGYIDRIRTKTSEYIRQNYTERTETFLQMMIECEELKNLAKLVFPNAKKQIGIECDKIISEIERLMTYHKPFKKGCCTVCLNQIYSFNAGYKGAEEIYYCKTCPEKINKSLNALGYETGAFAI